MQSSEAVARLIEAAAESRTPELAVAFRVLAALGGLRGELCGLRWSNNSTPAAMRAAIRTSAPLETLLDDEYDDRVQEGSCP